MFIFILIIVERYGYDNLKKNEIQVFSIFNLYLQQVDHFTEYSENDKYPATVFKDPEDVLCYIEFWKIPDYYMDKDEDMSEDSQDCTDFEDCAE